MKEKVIYFTEILWWKILTVPGVEPVTFQLAKPQALIYHRTPAYWPPIQLGPIEETTLNRLVRYRALWGLI